LAWHFQLLVQLLGEFHADKLRALQLKELSYLQAVHETGARLTHDIKNLLQSLQTLCHAADEAEAENSPEFRALLRRQLPALANRLGATLSKLKEAQDESPVLQQPVLAWWAELQRRYGHTAWLTMDGQIAEDAGTIPASMVFSVVENLLSNAEDKRARETGLCVTLSVQADAASFRLAVCDNGSPVPPNVVPRLLRAPVTSENGLGIGLYQVARLATAAGFVVELSENRDGHVCFTLRRGVSSASTS
jgi:signal transduction histidine kinase